MVSDDKAGDIVNAAPGDCSAIQVEMRSLLGHWSRAAIDLYIVQGTMDEFSSLSLNSDDAGAGGIEMDFLAGARGSSHGVNDDGDGGDEDEEVIDGRWDNEGELAEISGEPSIPPSAGQRRTRAKPARPARPDEDQPDQQAEEVEDEDECTYDFVENGGPMLFDVRSCLPAWGGHLLLPCGRALHSRWVGSRGQVWQDTAGREVGKALFTGNNNIRVTCWCHGTDSSLGAVTSGPCGGMVYCAGVWEHINEVLSWFFDLGTRYVVGLQPGEAAEQRRHHGEAFALAIKRLAEIRAARRVSGNAVAPGVPMQP